MCSTILPKKFVDSEPQLLDSLKMQSETLQNINIEFANIAPRFHIFFIREAKKTDLGTTTDFVSNPSRA
jgi:hypothetical protein